MIPKLIRGVYLPQSDTHFAEHLHKGPNINGHGTYQYNKISAAMPLVKQKGVALDIGAHVGLWSMILAPQFNRVVAFEPVPEHAECFKMNLEGRRHVTLHEYALGMVDGDVRMRSVADNSGNARVDDKGDFLVRCHELDDVPLGHGKIDFIKIDVEGFEEAVITGGQGTILANKPVMVVEQKPGHAEALGYKTGGAIKLLESWGMRQAWVKSGDYCMVWN